jgi:hypothetical protein
VVIVRRSSVDSHLKLTTFDRTVSAYLDRGLAEHIDLDSIVGSRNSSKASLVREVDNLTRYHKYIKSREYQNVAKRYTGEPDADDPCIVEGDGEFSCPRDRECRR